jgi:hypothetical protein
LPNGIENGTEIKPQGGKNGSAGNKRISEIGKKWFIC